MWFRDLTAHVRLRFTGKDRVRFLNGLFSNDVAALGPGGGCHAALLTVKGKVVADALILADEEALLMDLPAGQGARVREQLERHLIMDEVEIVDESEAVDEVGVGGAGARAALEAIVGPLPELPLHGHLVRGGTRIVATSDLGAPGFRLHGGARELAERIAAQATGAPPRWLDAATEERLRIEAGLPDHDKEHVEEHLPIEARLDDAVSNTKGCYMGQEVIARVTARGQINRRLRGLKLDGSTPAGEGAKLSAPEREDAGTVTSSVVSPTFGSIALAYVHRTVWAAGTELTVHEDGGVRKAVVVDLPFGAPAGEGV